MESIKPPVGALVTRCPFTLACVPPPPPPLHNEVENYKNFSICAFVPPFIDSTAREASNAVVTVVECGERDMVVYPERLFPIAMRENGSVFRNMPTSQSADVHSVQLILTIMHYYQRVQS